MGEIAEVNTKHLILKHRIRTGKNRYDTENCLPVSHFLTYIIIAEKL